MAIAYNAGTNIITVTGYTEGTPCNFTDVYNADVAGGWGKVTRQCTTQFCFAAYLHIGDGSTATWFADTKKQVFWEEIGGNWAKYIEVKNNAHFRIGKLLNESKKSTRDGCSIYHASTSYPKRLINAVADNADIRIYSSQLANGGLYRGTGVDGEFANTPPLKIYNSTLNSLALNGMDLTLYNVTITGNKTISSTYGLLRTIGVTDVIKIFDVARALYVGSGIVTFKNTVVKDYSVIYVTGVSSTMNIVNGDLDVWTFTFGVTCVCNRKYEFDLKVIDKDNVAINAATVKVWDKDSNLIVDTTTNASGVIATQTIIRGYYDTAHGNTLQEASPHLIKIEKAGYTTYEADFTLEEKTDWLIALQVGGGLMRNPSMTGGMV